MTTLPPLLVLTDGPQVDAAGGELVDVLRAVLDAGGPALGIVVRERHLHPAARAELVEWARAEAAPTGALVITASPATGPDQPVHLTAAEPVPEPRPPLLGRSCHDHGELRLAASHAADYATLSPVFATLSKPGYGPALGPDALRGAPLPVYALGGVTPGNAACCRDAGAVGLAVMGAVMRAPDPSGTVRELLDAFGGHAPR